MQDIGHPDRQLYIHNICFKIFSHHDTWICCCRVENHILDDAMNHSFVVIGLKINIHSPYS